MCSCFGLGRSSASKYKSNPSSQREFIVPPPEPEQPSSDFKFMPEPILSEITNYVRQRGCISLYLTTADVRAELTRNVSETLQQVDMYPKGRQFLHDEEYLAVMKVGPPVHAIPACCGQGHKLHFFRYEACFWTPLCMLVDVGLRICMEATVQDYTT
jgi:hypothetical protein